MAFYDEAFCMIVTCQWVVSEPSHPQCSEHSPHSAPLFNCTIKVVKGTYLLPRGATARVLGRQLPPPPPPPPPGASGRELVVKGMTPRSQRSPKAPRRQRRPMGLADDTLPSIVGRGGANCRITPRPHTQLFGGAPPPPPPPGTALPGAPARTTLSHRRWECITRTKPVAIVTAAGLF